MYNVEWFGFAQTLGHCIWRVSISCVSMRAVHVGTGDFPGRSRAMLGDVALCSYRDVRGVTVSHRCSTGGGLVGVYWFDWFAWPLQMRVRPVALVVLVLNVGLCWLPTEFLRSFGRSGRSGMCGGSGVVGACLAWPFASAFSASPLRRGSAMLEGRACCVGGQTARPWLACEPWRMGDWRLGRWLGSPSLSGLRSPPAAADGWPCGGPRTWRPWPGPWSARWANDALLAWPVRSSGAWPRWGGPPGPSSWTTSGSSWPPLAFLWRRRRLCLRSDFFACVSCDCFPRLGCCFELWGCNGAAWLVQVG